MRVLLALSVAVMVLWTNTCRLAAQGTKSEPGAKVGHEEAGYRGGLVSPPLPKPQLPLQILLALRSIFPLRRKVPSHFCFSVTRIALTCARCRCT